MSWSRGLEISRRATAIEKRKSVNLEDKLLRSPIITVAFGG